MGRCELRKAKQIKAPIDREIAEELTNRNILTPRGGDLWNAMTVMRVMKRLGISK